METEQIIGNLQEQLNHRLEKLWNVFSWSASLLTSITGGIIVATRGIQNFHLQLSDQVLLSVIILITTVYAWLMIRENLMYESKVRDQLEQLFAEKLEYPQLKNLRPDKAKFGYKQVIAILGIIAVIATWTGDNRLQATNGEVIRKTGIGKLNPACHLLKQIR